MTGNELQETMNRRGLDVRDLAMITGYTEARLYQLLALKDKSLPERTAIVLQVKLEAQEAS